MPKMYIIKYWMMPERKEERKKFKFQFSTTRFIFNTVGTHSTNITVVNQTGQYVYVCICDGRQIVDRKTQAQTVRYGYPYKIPL